jgi:4a-hydroxytetrahydrobiopterin dehydratase
MDKPLAEYSCVPCKGGIPPLTREQIAPLIVRLGHGWKVEEEVNVAKLVKRYKLKDFVQVVDFVNRILPIAEAEGHHPDLYVGWGKVTVYVWTHVIAGLTESDFYLAAKIDRAYEAMAPVGSAGPTPEVG